MLRSPLQKTLLLAAPPLAAAFFLLLAHATPSLGGGPDVTLSIGSATVLPAGSTTVDFTVTPAGGVTVGAMDINIDYNPAVLTPTACTPNASCNIAFDLDTVRIGGVDLSGLSGVEGSITFTAIGGAGTFSVLNVVIVNCVDDTGEPLNCADSDGIIDVSGPTPTPSPTPSPVPTATPSPTPSPSPTPTPTASPTPTPTPSPTPTPTASPVPTSTPTPSPTPTPPPLTWGDVDCSGVINAVDSLAIQRWKVGLTYISAPGCPGIGVPMLPTLWGDVDCTGVVNAVDSLAIQRWKVGLTVLQTPPCPVIGDPYP